MTDRKDPVRKETDRKEKFNRTVKFASTEADQVLLAAIEAALSSQTYASFSELCKQALRQLLLDPPATDALSSLQQQLLAVQLQVAKLEGFAEVWQACPIGRIEQQLGQLSDRLAQLESQKEDSAPEHLDSPEDLDLPAPIAEPDPLLSRLAPLLEDF